MKIRRCIESFLLLAGAAGLGVWLWSNARGAGFQHWENWVFDRKIRGEPATIAAYVREKKEQIAARVGAWWGLPAEPKRSVSAPAVPEPVRPRSIENNGLVGRLTIPRLHLSAMVREGTGEGTLDLALGHIPGTALPGEKGNTGVAGHRDTLFRALGEVRKDDRILFETLGGSYVYEVESTEIVSPENVSVLKASQYPELTLVTCYPFAYVGSAPDRFIVKARQVLRDPLPQKSSETAQANERTEPPAAVEHKLGVRKLRFQVSKNHSRQVAPGIWLGVTGTDVTYHYVDGWMWVMPDRRTIWLRKQGAPVVFYGGQDGRKRELAITHITSDSVSGYLLLPAPDRAEHLAAPHAAAASSNY